MLTFEGEGTSKFLKGLKVEFMFEQKRKNMYSIFQLLIKKTWCAYNIRSHFKEVSKPQWCDLFQ